MKLFFSSASIPKNVDRFFSTFHSSNFWNFDFKNGISSSAISTKLGRALARFQLAVAPFEIFGLLRHRRRVNFRRFLISPTPRSFLFFSSSSRPSLPSPFSFLRFLHPSPDALKTFGPLPRLLAALRFSRGKNFAASPTDAAVHNLARGNEFLSRESHEALPTSRPSSAANFEKQTFSTSFLSKIYSGFLLLNFCQNPIKMNEKSMRKHC